MHKSLMLALATLLSLLASPAWPAGSEEMTSRPVAGNGPTQVQVSLLLVFLAFVETMAGSKLASKENGLVLARRMDAWSRVLFPVAYAIVVYVFWIG